MDQRITDLFNTWVSQSRIEGGMAAFRLNADGMAALEIDQNIMVNFQARSSPPLLILFALVGALPQAQRSVLAEELLEANLMWFNTNGATLSLQRDADSNTTHVVVAQPITVHAGTAITELQRVFDNICLVALDWKARLESAQHWPLTATGTDAPPFGYALPPV
jgi:hypothetical protein